MAPIKRYPQFLGPAPVTKEQGDMIRAIAKALGVNVAVILRAAIDVYIDVLTGEKIIDTLTDEEKAVALHAIGLRVLEINPLEPEPVVIQEG